LTLARSAPTLARTASKRQKILTSVSEDKMEISLAKNLRIAPMAMALFAFAANALNALPLLVRDGAFAPDESAAWPNGAAPAGLTETFSTAGPVSLYGATKVASEAMAIEYGDAFGFPVVIDRCGVMAGPGQFGTGEQGIFSFWVRAWASGEPLRYLGFGGTGHQVRDALHPQDLANLVERQLRAASDATGSWNVGGGSRNAMSLAQLSAWCSAHFGERQVGSDPAQRKWDVPWVVMDSSRVRERFGWTSAISITTILDEIAAHHRLHPDWLSLSRPL
jgi:CDP-paratose 2-epimerase